MYKALARVDATAKYSHSGEMLSWGLCDGVVVPTLYCFGSRLMQNVASQVVRSQPECGIRSNRPHRLNEVRCIETKAKSEKLDTNVFVLNLDKFSRIWGGGGV